MFRRTLSDVKALSLSGLNINKLKLHKVELWYIFHFFLMLKQLETHLLLLIARTKPSIAMDFVFLQSIIQQTKSLKLWIEKQL